MNNPIKVFIADSNEERTNALIEYVSVISNITIVGHCSNGSKAFSMIKQSKPDVIIINLLLTETDGLSLIENINNSLPYTPKTICIFPIVNDFIIKYILDLGVSYFMLSPIEIHVIAQRIIDVFDTFHASHINSLSVPKYSSHRFEESIKMLLLEIGIPANLKGYLYLSYSIKLLIERDSISGSIAKELYPEVAIKFNSTVSRVERSIRHAIDVAWCRGKIRHMNEIFGINIYNDYEKPTSCEFISLLADRVTLIEKTYEIRSLQ